VGRGVGKDAKCGPIQLIPESGLNGGKLPGCVWNRPGLAMNPLDSSMFALVNDAVQCPLGLCSIMLALLGMGDSDVELLDPVELAPPDTTVWPDVFATGGPGPAPVDEARPVG